MDEMKNEMRLVSELTGHPNPRLKYTAWITKDGYLLRGTIAHDETREGAETKAKDGWEAAIRLQREKDESRRETILKGDITIPAGSPE